MSFSDIANMNMDEVERPKPLPEGTYNVIISNFEFMESSKKKTPGIDITFVVQDAGEDVDADQVESFLNGETWSDKEVERKTQYWLSSSAVFMFKEMCEAIGISTSGMTLTECAEQLQGTTCSAQFVHEIIPPREGETEERTISKAVRLLGA